jgi:hypothetical protein
MKKVLRFAGQVVVIAAITLALDVTLTNVMFPGLKRALSAPNEANDNAYLPAPYDHDLARDQNSTRVWGNVLYPWQTDRFGFRTGECVPREPEKGRENIFVIGDSFTEALGSSYEWSFAGLMACDAAREGKGLWNLGVASYSPAIYHRKIRAAAERLGITPDEIYVFLDLSDIDDDANVYRVDGDRVVRAGRSGGHGTLSCDPGRFLTDNFMTARLLSDLCLTSSFNYVMSVGRPRARWTIDPALMESWGRRGLEVADANLDKIVGGALPGMELPPHARRLSLAGQCRGRRSQHHPGHPLARLGSRALRALHRWLCAVLPRARRHGAAQILHRRRHTR